MAKRDLSPELVNALKLISSMPAEELESAAQTIREEEERRQRRLERHRETNARYRTRKRVQQGQEAVQSEATDAFFNSDESAAVDRRAIIAQVQDLMEEIQDLLEELKVSNRKDTPGRYSPGYLLFGVNLTGF